MHFENVYIESLGYTLPEKVVTSDEIEARLEPVYQRLRLPQGRLELMTGIQQRRFWSHDRLPSDLSIESGRRALQAAGIQPTEVGLLIHGSVCRDQLEPATACRVHWQLGLPADCMVYDTSNACLGMINGMLQAATMIELGQVDVALVVGTENGSGLVDNTIDWLNRSEIINRQWIKSAVASLTIGSSSAAILLTSRSKNQTGTRLHSVVARADTQHYELCHGDTHAEDQFNRPLMNTDSERLMAEGIETGAKTFAKLLQDTGWTREDIQRSICHQVGMAHRKGMLERLRLPVERDFATVQWLGNTGACALPSALAIAAQVDAIPVGSNLAMLGIGSGINCVMAGLSWQGVPVIGESDLIKQIPEGANATWHLVPQSIRASKVEVSTTE